MDTVSRTPIPPIPRKYPEYATRRGPSWGIIFLVLLLLVALGAAGYFYWQTREVKKTDTGTPSAETADLLEELNAILVLPTDEQPTIATVNDIEKLEGQPFFAKAKVGDKVIIYSKNQKVILYDPEVKKIVEVGSINLDNPIE